MVELVDTPILVTLKKETASAHDTTEEVALVDKIKNLTLSKKEYIQLISCNWWIHQGVEKAMINFFMESPTPQLRAFFDKKSKWLIKDLQELEVLPATLPFSAITYPAITTKAALIGGLYVVEGSMLGGQYMLRLFRKNPALSTIPHFHFYQGYEKQTGQRWKAFQKLANESTWTTSSVQQAVQQAKATFQFFQLAYEVGLRPF